MFRDFEKIDFSGSLWVKISATWRLGRAGFVKEVGNFAARESLAHSCVVLRAPKALRMTVTRSFDLGCY